jgi:hypothetical protein
LAVRAHIVQRDYKVGIKVPGNIAEARALDRGNEDNLWELSVEKEMKNVRVAFKVLDDGTRVPVGYQQIPCILIFDVKMDIRSHVCKCGNAGVGTNCTPDSSPE